MNLTSKTTHDSSFFGCKEQKALIFCSLRITTIFSLTPTPCETMEMLKGQSPQTLTTQAYLGTPSAPRYNSRIPHLAGKKPCCVGSQLPSDPSRLQKPTFLPFPFQYLPLLLTHMCLQVCRSQSPFLQTPRPAKKGRPSISYFFLLYRTEKAESGEVTCPKLTGRLDIDLNFFLCSWPEFPQLHLAAT